MVSGLSSFFAGSNITRLLKQGPAGQTVEMVAVSWIANPWDRSSRSMTLSVPPGFGACAVAGVAPVTMTDAARTSPTPGASKRKHFIVFPLLLPGVPGRSGHDPVVE